MPSTGTKSASPEVASGFVAGEPFAEDWGWVVPLENPSFPLWIGCGNQDGEGRFLCFISPDKPVVRRWLRKLDTTARVEQVAAPMEAALRKHPSTRELRWWTPGDR